MTALALVVKGSSQWDPGAVRLRFDVTEDGEHAVPVLFEGVKPDMFREGQGVGEFEQILLSNGTIRDQYSQILNDLVCGPIHIDNLTQSSKDTNAGHHYN